MNFDEWWEESIYKNVTEFSDQDFKNDMRNAFKAGQESIPAETVVGQAAPACAVAEIGKTFIIYTDEGNLALSQEDILNTIDADLDGLDNNDEITWTVLRKDMTEEEINNLPVI